MAVQVVDLPVERIEAASWNANEMDEAMRARLRRSVQRFGLVAPLVVRPMRQERYETVGGAQRLQVLRELGCATVPCVVVAANDAEARLLSQALNHLAGQDNPGLRGELLRRVLEATPLEQVRDLLPDSPQGLQALCTLGQEELARHLRQWEQTQAARLKHLTFQLLPEQLCVVEAALRQAMPRARKIRGHSPNLRGTALFVICQHFLRRQGGPQ